MKNIKQSREQFALKLADHMNLGSNSIELLPALEIMEEVLDGPIGDILTGEDMSKTGAYDALEIARAAIAKAEGRAE